VWGSTRLIAKTPKDNPRFIMEEHTARQIAHQLARPTGEGGVVITTAMNATNAFITTRALDWLAPARGERLLEIGPGNGRLTLGAVQTLGPEGSYLGFEYAQDTAALVQGTLGKEAAHVQVLSGDFLSHPPASPGDALLAVNVVYFFDDLTRFTACCFEWLRPGGRLVIGQRSVSALEKFPPAEYGFHVRPLDRLLHSLHAAGFAAIEARYFGEGITTLGDLTLEVDSIVVRAERPH
jgi:SAM-dependent methyltransferase